MEYLVYFRVRRGGTGIPYALARAEFLALYKPALLRITREVPSKYRMWVDLSLSADAVAEVATDLGYTEAILSLDSAPFDGVDLQPAERGRWLTGWVREGEQKVLQTEVYVQDKASLLEDAPSNRVFEIRQKGKTREAFGHRSHRALSSLDARFVFNMVGASPTDLILDPFAGYGGFVAEGRRRGLRILASDIDSMLSPGLAALAPGSYGIADALGLPVSARAVDLIITEPPFRTAYRQTVLDSVGELRRILKPGGRLVLMIASNMAEDLRTAVERCGGRVEQIAVIPRNGGMKSPVLIATFDELHLSD